MTIDLKKDFNHLFIYTIRPHNSVSAQTIRNWIKSLLEKAEIDIKIFSVYTVKHASVSSAGRKGVDICTIRRTAGWSDGSETFARFYNRPIQEPSVKFARAVLSKK